jgi:hypothetical protein
MHVEKGGHEMIEKRQSPHRREPMEGRKNRTGMQHKDKKYLYNEKHKSRKNTISASDHLDRQVYGVLLKKSCTTKMICAMLGDAYSYQRVRHSVIRLNKRRLIYYWGLDFCEVTGHKAYYLEVRDSRQKNLPKNRNSYGR